MNTPEALTQALKEKLGANLQSVLLYGSAVTTNAVPGFSGTNLLIILESLGPDTLDVLRPLIVRWVRGGHSAPKFFTLEELKGARDVFPIEFLDMQEAHRVVYGNDLLANLDINAVNLRHQLEYELRAALLKLRTGYIKSGDNPRELLTLAAESLSGMTVLFRATLRVMGEPLPSKWPEVWASLNRRVPLDLDGLETIRTLREKPRLRIAQPEKLFARLLTTLEAVVRFVDSKDGSKI